MVVEVVVREYRWRCRDKKTVRQNVGGHVGGVWSGELHRQVARADHVVHQPVQYRGHFGMRLEKRRRAGRRWWRRAHATGGEAERRQPLVVHL